MFGRRVFGSTPIPRSMYATLRISSPKQASRMLPMLVPLTPSLSTSSGALARAFMQGASESMPKLEIGELDPVMLKSLVESMSPLQLGFSRLFELWGIARAVVVNSRALEARL